MRRTAAIAVGLVLLAGCTSDPEPAPDPSASGTAAPLTPPADLGDVLLQGTVRLDGDGALLSGSLQNNSPDEVTVTGISCACASGIRMGTVEDGAFVPLSGGLAVPAGGSLTFGGEGEPRVELTGLLPSTVPDAVVPVMAYLSGRPPVQGVAAVEAP